MLPANVRVDWKVIARYKQSSLFGLIFCNEEKKVFIALTPGVDVINFFSPSILKKPIKLERLSLEYLSRLF